MTIHFFPVDNFHQHQINYVVFLAWAVEYQNKDDLSQSHQYNQDKFPPS